MAVGLTDSQPRLMLVRHDNHPGAEGRALGPSPALIVSADEMICQRLAHIVNSTGDAAEVTIVSGFVDARASMRRMAYAFAVIDVDFPEGLELVSRMRRDPRPVPILALASHERDDSVMAVLHAGASGYALKERDDVELLLSIKSIQRGGMPIDSSVVRSIVSLLLGPGDTGVRSDGLCLSARELEVLQLMARGFSNRDIAELISRSHLTVEGYTKSIYRKLGVGSRTAAVFEAQRLGLLR
jgi:DNA-binding NarL/FixJ family response regulator